MSAHENEPGQDEHDHFDGEPVRALSPGEPQTPGWVPLVGVALFSLAGVYFLSTMDSEGDASGAEKPDATASAEVKPVAPPPPAAPAAARPRPAGAAAPSGQAPLGLTKEKAMELIDAARERKRRGEAGKPE